MSKKERTFKKNPKKNLLAVLAAIVLALVLGSFTDKETTLFGLSLYNVYDALGKLFINSLNLVVVPLVAASIITGVARIGNEQDFGRLGVKTFAFYVGTSLIAICIGLFFINVIHPGKYYSAISASAMGGHDVQSIQNSLAASSNMDLMQLLTKIVPPNIFAAFSTANMLGIIFFSFLFGFAISKTQSRGSKILFDLCEGVFDTMIHITHLVMKLLPIGVFCLVSKVFMECGFDSLKSLLYFFISIMAGFAVFSFIAMPVLLKVIGKVSPIRLFRAMGPALITAFSTSSSAATLPVTIDCVEKRAGVSNRICSLVIPLGTSINMSGSALYECAAAMFVAQVYGIDLSIGTQCALVGVSLIASMGVAGIPSGSLVALLIVLKSMGLPAEGMGLFFAIDRIIDMSRTAVNVFSDSCCAILVARTEGEKDVLSDENDLRLKTLKAEDLPPIES